MVTNHKRVLGIVAVLSIASLSVQPVSADSGTFFRKGFGLVGAGMVVNGLLNMVKKSPSQGLKGMIYGAVVSLGSIFSDIFYNRVASLVRKIKIQNRQPRTGLLGGVQNFMEPIVDRAQDVFEGGVGAIKEAFESRQQIESGLDNLKKRNIGTAIDQITDGAYRNIRARCRIALYPELWGQQQ